MSRELNMVIVADTNTEEARQLIAQLSQDPAIPQSVVTPALVRRILPIRANPAVGVMFWSSDLQGLAADVEAFAAYVKGEAAVKGGSLTAFEKACDNAVLKTAAGARQVPFGVEVALGYLIAKEAEWTAVRIVMAGRLAGLSADAIRERLRDAYV